MPVPLIPREVLFGNPERVSPALSPGGTRLAYLAPDEGVLNLWVRTVGADDDRPVTKDRDRGILGFGWAHDDRHLLYIQDQAGDENYHVYAVDPSAGDQVRDLTPFEGIQARIMGWDKEHPDELLLGINADNPQLHDVYRLQISSGELVKVAENPGFAGWISDANLEVRGALKPRPDGGYDLLVRDGADDEWRLLLEVDRENSLATHPVGFTRDGASFDLVNSVDSETGRLERWDLATGRRETLVEDARYDVADVVRHPDTSEVQAAIVLRDRKQWVVLDEAIAGDVEVLQALRPGAEMALLSRDHADSTWLVAFNDDDAPVSYYAWDRASATATHLFDSRPRLHEYRLAPMEPFRFTARDGLEIEGYLTFPAETERRGLPAVVYVHGGPWVRDVWGYEPTAQWLANRGYLCVQVNYRGSTGYGKQFANAGNREWGARMHDDLVDAVSWVVEQGYADRDRLAIMGGSYGGYAALVGATFTPDLLRCAVDLCGPSNLKTLIESVPPYWLPMIAQFHERVGNPETEEAFLWSRSPLSRVDDICIPILVAQGANDPRVKQAEAEQIVGAMRDKGLDHEYLLFDDEGHGLVKPHNRLRYIAAVEAFLARHLGGRAEP